VAIFENECESCGREEEVLQKHYDPPPVCETCKYEMKKKVSLTAFQLEGRGWARDNYGLKKSGD
jgi:putative FmdB family regulatory protein